MPNDVAHLLTVRGPKSELEKMIEAVRAKDSAFSFQRIVPMPAELSNTLKGFIANESQEQIAAREARSQELFNNFGASNWYDWRISNWGTKWDAYGEPLRDLRKEKWAELKQILQASRDVDQYDTALENMPDADYEPNEWWEWNSDEEVVGSFDTAWAPATHVYAALAQQFPTLTFTYEYADDGGFFVCREFYEGGVQKDYLDYDWDSPEGIEIRRNVGYYCAEDEEDAEDDQQSATEEEICPDPADAENNYPKYGEEYDD